MGKLLLDHPNRCSHIYLVKVSGKVLDMGLAMSPVSVCGVGSNIKLAMESLTVTDINAFI